ncbi:hypothetical protein SZL87_01090 [Exiguobacterium indicum]|uniref:Uncharacterized protein n=1 Tax=Exiguobacterium indicum TaxID=296995 RepID=A0ABU8EDJ5_9BACL
MLIQIIGIFSIIFILGLIFTNQPFKRIIVVLFASSIIIFVARILTTQQSIAEAFFNSFGFLTILAFVIVIIQFYKKQSTKKSNP